MNDRRDGVAAGAAAPPVMRSTTIDAAIAALGPGSLTEAGLTAHVAPLFSRARAESPGTIYLANHSLGRPLYVSLSRKDFVGAVLAGSWEGRLEAPQRGPGTIAAAALAAAAGAQVHRLHDISALDAVRTAARIAASA